MTLIQKMKAAAKLATPGPWVWHWCCKKAYIYADGKEVVDAVSLRGAEDIGCGHYGENYGGIELEEDAEYIALCSPDNLLALIAAVEVYEKALRRAANELSDSLEFSYAETEILEALAAGRKLLGEG